MATRADVVAAAARFMGADTNEPVPQEAVQEELNKHPRPESEEHLQCVAALGSEGGYLSVCNQRLAEILGDARWRWF